jgi:uroporphyrinogen-III synthase
MLLITRPEPDASRSATALNKLGFKTLIEPMMRIENKPNMHIDATGVQAFLVTSANGARAFAAATENRSVKVLAVGSATADALKEANFTNIHMAGGDVQSLAVQVVKICTPAAGRLIHIAASNLAGNLVGLLKVAGFKCDKVVLYSADAVTELGANVIDKLEKGEISGVLFYSPRTAAIFTGLIEGAALGHLLKPIMAWCLSRAVAEKLDTSQWDSIRVAGRPDQPTLFALLSQSEKDSPVKESKEEQIPEKSERVEVVGDAVTAKPVDDAPASLGEKRVSEKKTEPPKSDIPILNKPIGTETKQPVAKPEKKSSFGLIVTFLIIFFFAGMAVWPLFYPMVKGYLPAYVGDIIAGRFGPASEGEPDNSSSDKLEMLEQIAALEFRLTQIRSDLDSKISAQTGSSENPDAALKTDLQALSDQLALTIEEKIANLRDEFTSRQSDTAARLDQQSVRLDEIAQVSPTAQTETGTDTDTGTPVAAAQPDLSPVIEDIKAQIAALATKVDQASAMAAENQQQAANELHEQANRLQALDARIATLPDQAAGGRDAALALAYSRIVEHMNNGTGFADSLALFKTSAPEEAKNIVDTLSQFEQNGVWTTDRLRVEFSVLADQLVHVARLPDDDSWIGKTISTIASSVKFRQTGDVDGDSVEAIVARTEMLLEKADIKAALGELGKLQGKPADMTKDWISAAKDRLAAEEALSGLQDVVTGLALQSLQKSE